MKNVFWLKAAWPTPIIPSCHPMQEVAVRAQMFGKQDPKYKPGTWNPNVYIHDFVINMN